MTLKRKHHPGRSPVRGRKRRPTKSNREVEWTVIDFLCQNGSEVKLKWGKTDVNGDSAEEDFESIEWIPRANVVHPDVTLEGVPYGLRHDDPEIRSPSEKLLKVSNPAQSSIEDTSPTSNQTTPMRYKPSRSFRNVIESSPSLSQSNTLPSSSPEQVSPTSPGDHNRADYGKNGSPRSDYVLSSPFQSSQIIRSTNPAQMTASSPRFIEPLTAKDPDLAYSDQYCSLGDRSVFGMTVSNDFIITTSSSVHTLLSIPVLVCTSTIPETQSQEAPVSHSHMLSEAQISHVDPVLETTNRTRSTSPTGPDHVSSVATSARSGQRINSPSSWPPYHEQGVPCDVISISPPGDHTLITTRWTSSLQQTTYSTAPQACDAVPPAVSPEAAEDGNMRDAETYNVSMILQESLPLPPSQLVDTLATAPPRPTLSSASMQGSAYTEADTADVQCAGYSTSPAAIESSGAPELTEAQKFGPPHSPSESQVEQLGSFLDRRAFDMDPAHNERVVPVYFGRESSRARQQDSYLHLINNPKSRELASKFAESGCSQDPRCVEAVDTLLAQLHQVTQHSNLLDNDDPSQQPQTAEMLVWHCMFSAKLHFIERLMKDEGQPPCYAVVVIKDKRMLRIVEQFMKASDVFVWHNMDTRPIETAAVLLADGAEQLPSGPADVVVLLDGFHGHKYESLRALSHGLWAPLIALVVPFTPEHLLRCLDNGSPHARRAQLFDTLIRLKRLAGEHADPAINIIVAKKLRRLVNMRDSEVWDLESLPSVEPLAEFVRHYEETRSGRRQSIPASQMTTQSPNASEASIKRKRDGPEEKADAIKKARLVEPDTTHVSDSVGHLSQPASHAVNGPSSSTLPVSMPSIQPAVPSAVTIFPSEADKHLKELELDITAKDLTIADLKCIMDDREGQMQDLRDRFVAQTTKRDELVALVEKLSRSKQVAVDREQGLRDSRDEIRQQLKTAQESLANHTIPERAELENAWAENRRLQTQSTALEKRLADSKGREAYFFEQYQRLSQEGPEMRARISELEGENEALKIKASAERVKALSMTEQMQLDELHAEIARLRTQVSSLNETVTKQDKTIRHLKALDNARTVTRGSRVRENSASPVPR